MKLTFFRCENEKLDFEEDEEKWERLKTQVLNWFNILPRPEFSNLVYYLYCTWRFFTIEGLYWAGGFGWIVKGLISFCVKYFCTHGRNLPKVEHAWLCFMLVVFVSAVYQLAAFVQLHSLESYSRWGRGEGGRKQALGEGGVYLTSGYWGNLKYNGEFSVLWPIMVIGQLDSYWNQ